MNSAQQQAFDHAVSTARDLMRLGALDAAFPHLERAHVLGQYEVLPHVLTHALMLQHAVLAWEPLAALGQAVRIVLGALGSALGHVPVGNTGGSNVSMFAPMPIAPELQVLLQGDVVEGAQP